MTGKSSERILILAITLCSLLLFVSTVRAQTPTPRETLIEKIETLAKQDVEWGRYKDPSDLEAVFKDESAAVGMSIGEVVEIYGIAYQAALETRSPVDVFGSWLTATGGWIVALILALWIVLQDSIKKLFSELIALIAKTVYQKLAGVRPFWMFSLRRYRQALARDYGYLKILFRPDPPINMQDIYVPLRAMESANLETLDIYGEIRKHKFVVVVGTPGAGKTMLLRHIALTYARRGLKDFANQPVPVLLELHHLNDRGVSILHHITQVLNLKEFPGASRFLQASLQKGRILLLLDGLDEVSTQARDQVVQEIKDFLAEYRHIRAVVTCRTQVYRGEFVEEADQGLQIVDFNDREIQHFLRAWNSFEGTWDAQSIENFLTMLRERPQIMGIARNPLLLTMIAYLYSDPDFHLPHSRAEFYLRATELLLEKWKGKRNRYRAINKRLVLQSLALFNQTMRTDSDRASMELTLIRSKVRDVLPSLTLKEDDIDPILDEIVERSGLLIPVDGGSRIQFTHLTLQEFFAAQALEAEPQELLAMWKADNDAWREVIRLWCGLGHDSTNLIRTVANDNPILALECLGDAQKVDSSFADTIIKRFQEHLIDVAKKESIAHALALVAASPHRGSTLFDFLKNRLDHPSEKSAAALVLSMTGLPKAADALANRGAKIKELRQYLNNMGDLAVLALTTMAEKDESVLLGDERVWLLNALHQIGTPLAALALTQLLWHESQDTCYYAATRLAMLIHKPNVSSSLRMISITAAQRNSPQIAWIWLPFPEPSYSALPVISGRCAYLLRNAPTKSIPDHTSESFDARLVVPLVLIEQTQSTGLQSYLLRGLPYALRRKVDVLMSSKYAGPKPTQNDWLNMFLPVKYDFFRSRQSFIVKALLIIVSLLGILEIGKRILTSIDWATWTNAAYLLGAGFLLLVIQNLWQYRFDQIAKNIRGFRSSRVIEFGINLAVIALGIYIVARINAVAGRVVGAISAAVVASCLFLAYFVYASLIRAKSIDQTSGSHYDSSGYLDAHYRYSEFRIKKKTNTLLVILCGIYSILVMYLVSALLSSWYAWTAIILFWVVWISIMCISIWYGILRQRRASNPLYGLFDEYRDGFGVDVAHQVHNGQS